MTENNSDFPKIAADYVEFQENNTGFGPMIILSKDGHLEYTTDENFCSATEAQQLHEVWMNHKSAVILGDIRYAVLSWEPLQFAARNVQKKGAIIGCKTKSNKYIIAFLRPSAKIAPTIAAIKLNRWSWNRI